MCFLPDGLLSPVLGGYLRTLECGNCHHKNVSVYWGEGGQVSHLTPSQLAMRQGGLSFEVLLTPIGEVG